jgi:glucose-6-phosphate isomerase
MSVEGSGSVEARLRTWDAEDVAARLWRRDGSLWSPSGKKPDALAAWLGWLDLSAEMRARVGELEHLVRDITADGYRRAAVLGMGGSSLAPELFARTFGRQGSGAGDGSVGSVTRASAEPLELRILDSTHPDAVRGFREWAASARTLFCVSSKSGTTTEPNAYHAAMSAVAPALDFVAITDPETPLVELARAQEFRAIVEAPPDVGGRYSALTVFGLVPAALGGVDLGRLLDAANEMADACRRSASQNPGLRLGAHIGEWARAGRDKLTVVVGDRITSFGDWVEQLLAESTGKQGTGIVPIVGEPLTSAADYADDRAFVLLHLADDATHDWSAAAEELRRAGHPVEELVLKDPYALGGEFVRWEVATAAAGMVLGIDPFDQPNVQESKDATRELLDVYRRDGALPLPAPVVTAEGISVTADPATLGDTPVSVAGAVRQLIELIAPGRDYFALLAYLPPDPDVVERLERIRLGVRAATRCATTLGLGPRYLHSTGQLHKGGPDTGVFLQLTAEPRKDLPIPGWSESFGTLIAAQAIGDLASLQRRRRRVLRLHLADLDSGLSQVEALVAQALPAGIGVGGAASVSS